MAPTCHTPRARTHDPPEMQRDPGAAAGQLHALQREALLLRQQLLHLTLEPCAAVCVARQLPRQQRPQGPAHQGCRVAAAVSCCRHAQHCRGLCNAWQGA
jgi:hypothetical protein